MNTDLPKSIELDRVKQAAAFIEDSLHQHYTIKQIARKVKLSEKTLKQIFREHYGMGLYAYLKAKRMDKAKEMLLKGASNKVIIAAIGYEKETTFCRAFKEVCKESPLLWKENYLSKAG